MCQKIIYTLFVVGLVMGLSACTDGKVNPGDTPDDTSVDTDPDTADEVDTDSGFVSLGCDTEACEPIDPLLGYGKTAENMACALGLCGDALVDAGVTSINPMNGEDTPGAACRLENMARSLTQFGDEENDLAPEVNGAHVFLANAPITLGTWGPGSDGCEIEEEQIMDIWTNEEIEPRRRIYDVPELRLELKAPAGANGVVVRYVYMSSEWDDVLRFQIRNLREGNGMGWGNDKCYIMKNDARNKGKLTDRWEYDYMGRDLLNYTHCRFPDLLWDWECTVADGWCSEGERICSIGVFSGVSECCWFECDDDNLWTTDITGTGFECAADEGAETGRTGSSTGWLETSFPVKPGEEFELILHVHDTGDMYGGSAALFDSVKFVKEPVVGTVPI